MATFRKRSGSWQALVKKKGFGQIGRTFDTKAEAWAKIVEAEMVRGVFPPESRPKVRLFPKPWTGMSGKSPPSKKGTCKRENEFAPGRPILWQNAFSSLFREKISPHGVMRE